MVQILIKKVFEVIEMIKEIISCLLKIVKENLKELEESFWQFFWEEEVEERGYYDL
jgi:hypothetical protein